MAEYFNVDIALMRLIWVLAFFAGGFGLEKNITPASGEIMVGESFGAKQRITIFTTNCIMKQLEGQRRTLPGNRKGSL